MNTRHSTICLLLPAALALGATTVRADGAAPAPERNEIVVFGGISLLDASRSSQLTIQGDGFEVQGMRGFGGRFRPPFTVPPISVDGETRIGSSALFGARYSRAIKDRLALEADLTVAPGHELESSGRGCVGDLCFGPESGRGGDARLARSFGGRGVTAWHYGAGLAYELTGGDVRPLVILGAGGVTWDGAGRADTDFVLRFGAGLKVLFGRVGARVDVVDHLVLNQFLTDKTEHDVHATAGLLVRF